MILFLFSFRESFGNESRWWAIVAIFAAEDIMSSY
jgi:hypothetical protein